MKKTVIEAVDLTKIYKLKGQNEGIKALDNINLSIKEGEIFGLLGPNGAGKTTLIQILTTILHPTSGQAFIDGYNIQKNPKQAKSRIALMLDRHMVYFRITAYDNLKFFCKIYKVPNYKQKIENLTKEFGLYKWLNQYVGNFSTGMQMKIALCRTLLLERDILFLDEPTLGLDVKSIRFIVDKLKGLNKTIFLTSHDMNVVEKLCDRIAYINKGIIVKIGSKRDIQNAGNNVRIDVEIVENVENLILELEKQNFINIVKENNTGLLITLKDKKFYRNLLEILARYDILRINENEVSLEELFIRLT